MTMGMDFGALPPEINSARMYAGPGSAPLVQAARAWGRLANELNATAASYSSVIAGLGAADWQGPSALSMAAAAAPYVAWMRSTAAQAEQAAAQAISAANAYESAHAAIVPPGQIAANRSTMLSLVRSNIFGQNTPAIATSEADYSEMWAQDIVAMDGYAGTSAAATDLAPFTSPPATTTGTEALSAATVRQRRKPAFCPSSSRSCPPRSTPYQTHSRTSTCWSSQPWWSPWAPWASPRFSSARCTATTSSTKTRTLRSAAGSTTSYRPRA